eukprot:gene16814-23096_t
MLLRCFGVSKALALESESGAQAEFCSLKGVRYDRDIVQETQNSCPAFTTVVALAQSLTQNLKHAKGKYGMPIQEVTTLSSLCPPYPSRSPIGTECSLHPGDRNYLQESAPSQESSSSSPSSFRQYFRPRPPKKSRSWIDGGTTVGENARQFYNIVQGPEVEEDRNGLESALDFTDGMWNSSGGLPALPANHEPEPQSGK